MHAFMHAIHPCQLNGTRYPHVGGLTMVVFHRGTNQDGIVHEPLLAIFQDHLHCLLVHAKPACVLGLPNVQPIRVLMQASRIWHWHHMMLLCIHADACV